MVGALLRLTEIEAGQILIDSMDIRNVRLARLRSAVSVVPQSAFLFEVCIWLVSLYVATYKPLRNIGQRAGE